MNGLDSAIRDAGAAAYAAYGSSADANVRYLTRFHTTDPVVYV
ncbi:MAG: aminopeptidase P family protein, partial [Methanomicrobiales archaeon HGW-Methanomicrobiales-5]